MQFDGKVAIVTGGGTGLGAAVSRGLADQGAKVLVLYRSSAADAQNVVRACQASGVDAFDARCDVARDEDCVGAVEAAMARWGRIDMLINSAGQTKSVPMSDLGGLSGDDFVSIYKTNVVGAFQMIRACMPHFQRLGSGAVVNVSSLAGLTGTGSSLAYAASKGALNTLTKSLSRALAPIIRVNAVCPGFMDTNWFAGSLSPEGLEDLIQSQKIQAPLQRVATADEVARSVLFLLGDGANLITGITMSVDAGAHLGARPSSIPSGLHTQLM